MASDQGAARMPPPPNLRRDFVHRQLSRVLEHLKGVGDDGVETQEGDAVNPEPARAARDAIAASLRHETPPAADYYSRSPVVNLAQSAFDEQSAEDRARIEGDE